MYRSFPARLMFNLRGTSPDRRAAWMPLPTPLVQGARQRGWPWIKSSATRWRSPSVTTSRRGKPAPPTTTPSGAEPTRGATSVAHDDLAVAEVVQMDISVGVQAHDAAGREQAGGAAGRHAPHHFAARTVQAKRLGGGADDEAIAAEERAAEDRCPVTSARQREA